MRVKMSDRLEPLADRLIDYGFDDGYSRLVDRLADKGILTDEDIWYVTGEYWKLVRNLDTEKSPEEPI